MDESRALDRTASVSVLAGLFNRIRDDGLARDPLEDFTTEAIAGAIRRDPRPMLSALARTGSFDPGRVAGHRLAVFTQRTHVLPDDEIRLDLVLAWSAPGSALELWIEVKTGAPLSGADQLDRYLRAQSWRTARDGVSRPPLVLLSSVDLRLAGQTGRQAAGTAAVAHLRWQDIIDAVRDTVGVDTLWLELARFLKEKRMTQDSTFPITAREATSLADAHRLYLKSMDLLVAVNALGAERFPHVAAGWWPKGNIATAVRNQFRDNARFCLSLWGGSGMGFFFGLDVGAASEATYAVWMEADPRYAEVRARAHAVAEAGDLGRLGWALSYDGWRLLEVRAHKVNFASLDDATAWFLARFGELDHAGLFVLQREFVADGSQPADLPDDPDGPSESSADV